ncbi:MAG: DNA topoisomerase I, partial [Thermoproteota archaeon]
LKKTGEGVDMYVNCCDYDVEGSLIGYNVLRYVFSAPDRKCRRMKVSTLTEGEVRGAFSNLQPGLDFEMISAGEARHVVDFLYGVNLSRALTNAARTSLRTHVTVSTGRVQGPTLKFIVDREKENRSFVPVPYWTAEALIEVSGKVLRARYERERLGSADEVERLLADCRGRDCTVSSVKTSVSEVPPPAPFDLGTLQSEAYRAFRFSPSRTLRISERLYLGALISYPRTSSQKLPEAIGYRDIIGKLREGYEAEVGEILGQPFLKPREGAKDDPAHPAIYPTGEKPERELSGDEKKILDLVTRRFLSTFAKPAAREASRIEVEVGGHKFILLGRRVVEEGWLGIYGPYSPYREEELPELHAGKSLKAEVVSELRYTQPPPRFNPASIVRLMEEKGIGTKATRSEILETLFKRGYVSGERIEASELGIALVETLERFSPKIVSVELTAELESKMEKIELGEMGKEAVVEEAVRQLEPILEAMKSREEEIGKSLFWGAVSALLSRRIVGDCPVCRSGKLTIIHSRKTGKRFVGCSNYSNGGCRFSAPIPQRPYAVVPTKARCAKCGWNVLLVRKKGSRPWRLCVNPDCPAKSKGPGS